MSGSASSTSSNVWRDSVKNFKVNQGLSLMVRDVVPT